jgi:uncharacterized protein YggU (UPF0235/DUF167 family)
MEVFVTVTPRAKVRLLTKIDDTHFALKVREPAKENKANFAVLEAIADYFSINVSRVAMISGKNSRNKVIFIQT